MLRGCFFVWLFFLTLKDACSNTSCWDLSGRCVFSSARTKCYGPVSDDPSLCRRGMQCCLPPSRTPREISDDCFHPTGDSCDFYRLCVEAAHPCSGSGQSYALDYGERYCRRYNDFYEHFSARGKAWVDATRTCLQKALVPVFSKQMTCGELRRVAFDSHTRCYVNPSPGVSYCDLPLWDRVVLVPLAVKPAVFSDFGESVRGVLDTASACLGLSDP